MGLKQPNSDVFEFLVGTKKINNPPKMSWPPFDIQRSKMHVAVKHFAKVGFTYFVKVLLTNVRRMSLVKTLLDGKFTFKCNQKVNLYNQTNSIVFNGKKTIDEKQHYVFQEFLLGFMIFWEWV